VRKAEELLVRRQFARCLDKTAEGLRQLSSGRAEGPERHMCVHARCPCARLLVAAGQAQFELGRGAEFLPLVLRVYGGSPVPFPVARLAARLLRRLQQGDEATALLGVALERDAASYSEAQRCVLLEELCLALPRAEGAAEAALGRPGVPKSFSESLAARLSAPVEVEKVVNEEEKKKPEVTAPAPALPAVQALPAPVASGASESGARLALLKGPLWWALPALLGLWGLWRFRRPIGRVARDAFTLAFGSKQL
jgi:hypothetical protein